MDSCGKSLIKKAEPELLDATSKLMPTYLDKTEKRKSKKFDPSLKVMTSRSRLQGCVSQLNTPATDITPFHSPADPTKLNQDGPNWHLFNKKVADSLQDLDKLRIQDDTISISSVELQKKHDLKKEDC